MAWPGLVPAATRIIAARALGLPPVLAPGQQSSARTLPCAHRWELLRTELTPRIAVWAAPNDTWMPDSVLAQLRAEVPELEVRGQ